MATDLQEKMNPDFDFHSNEELSEDIHELLKIMEEFDDEEEEEEDEFSFVVGDGEDLTAVDGQIKTVFPLFDQSLLHSCDGGLPMRPPVKKVFVEAKDESGSAVTSSSSGSDAIAGPCCDWSSRKAVEASPETCKKSNSTGFSKIWRMKEMKARSNSDGRDAFVFLNGSHAPPPAEAEKKEAAALKKSGKSKASAHEVYLRSKAKEERRRSYLPYRPELMGFFTNVNGGLTRNVHPF